MRPVSKLLALAVLVCAALPAIGQETATYEVRFEALWNAVDHPQDFPPNPHFSPLVGATHSAAADFWSPGGLATEGIRLMAEQGMVVPLRSEVRAVPAEADYVEGDPVNISPGEGFATLTVSEDHPLVTLVTMVAPSPDWFVGVDSMPLMEGGDWLFRKTVDLFPWDAGTDSGTTFRSPNQVSVPRQTIHPIAGFPFTGTPALGRYVFERTDAPPPEPLVLGDDRFEITALWTTENGSSNFGTPVPLTDDTGYFWFFNQNNVEIVVKVLDACGFANRFWIFAGGLTNVGVELTVRDVVADEEKTYTTQPGPPFQPIQDTVGLATCPAG